VWRASLPSVEDARPLGLALATPIPARAYSQLAGLSQPAMGRTSPPRIFIGNRGPDAREVRTKSVAPTKRSTSKLCTG